MLPSGFTYSTPDFDFTVLSGKLYRFSTSTCARSWRQHVVRLAEHPKPEAVLGFRSGALLQDWRSGTLWLIDGARRREVDYDAWVGYGFSWEDVLLCTRAELELHEPGEPLIWQE
jgi:hypothetical protein